MLFRASQWDGLRDGSITVAFRRWKRPTVKAGGRLRSPAGVLAIHSVDAIDESSITMEDAHRAGFPSVEAVINELRPPQDGYRLYRIGFERAGDDDRVELRNDSALDDAARSTIQRRLDRMDAASRWGPWTRRVLALIDERPGVRAGDLAADVGRERLAFKADVRKLKALGLTESLEVGYRLSPRGRAFLHGS